MSPHRYASEKLMQAVRILALSDDPLRERLLRACESVNHLADTDHIADPNLRARFEALHDQVTSHSDPGNVGTLTATISTMTDGDIDVATRELFDIAVAVESMYSRTA